MFLEKKNGFTISYLLHIAEPKYVSEILIVNIFPFHAQD